jgi:acyl-CoA reductase-like NAD-dependent aldehyde dehydrogenase
MHLSKYFPRVHLNELTRRAFINEHARNADAVIFTGRYESAEEVRAQCPNGLFIFQGSGVNPIVIGRDADLDDNALDNMVTARVFNGGQDCAAPDAYLVHTQRADEFVRAMVERVELLVSGGYDDPNVRVGRILNPQTLPGIAARLAELEADTVLGGIVDQEFSYVSPTVIVRPLEEHDELMEFFAPIFYVLVYENDAELATFFDHPDYRENAMYASFYGQGPVGSVLESSTVLFDRTVLEVEQGNTAFGGNGPKSNYVAFDEQIEVGPARMSEALARYLRHINAEAVETDTAPPAHPSAGWWFRQDAAANHTIAPFRHRSSVR